MRVDEVFGFALRLLFDLGEVGDGVGGVLVVDQEDAILADAEAEIAALPDQHGDARAEIDGAGEGLGEGAAAGAVAGGGDPVATAGSALAVTVAGPPDSRSMK